MRQRIVSTIILWLVIAGILVSGHATTAALFLALLSALTQWECYDILEKLGQQPMRILGLIGGQMVLLGGWFFGASGLLHTGMGFGIWLGLACVVCGLGAMLFHREPNLVARRLGPTLLGLVLIPFLFSFLLEILRLPERHFLVKSESMGLWLVVWVVATTKFTDVGALLTGLAIGRHKFAPAISPKKTWEGVVGGLVLSMAVAAALVAWVTPLQNAMHPGVAALLALPLAWAGIASDLFESALKREAGLKDSGAMIPGIGGAFDLTDSFLFAAPLAWLLLHLFAF